MNKLNEYRRGLLCALGCYLIWGLFPLYWYPVMKSGMAADQILAQRICWSAVFAAAVLLLSGKGRQLAHLAAKRKTLAVFAASAAAISVNWLVYLWAITHHRILEASLGYFVAPLVSVLFGRIFFGERLNRTKIAAVGLVAVGIVWLALPEARLPWVSLMLAVSFGIYGLLRKLAPADPLTGMTLETLLMLPFAAAYLAYAAHNGVLVFSQLPLLPQAVLVGSGVITVVPLLLFAMGAKRISMSDMGMIQYLSPSMQFLLGITLFGEAFDLYRFGGYAWVWLGIAVYLFGSLGRKTLPR